MKSERKRVLLGVFTMLCLFLHVAYGQMAEDVSSEREAEKAAIGYESSI